jgi:hypothetical protein
MLAARQNFAPKETLPDKLLAHIASLGWEHIGFSGGYLWPSDNAIFPAGKFHRLLSSLIAESDRI